MKKKLLIAGIAILAVVLAGVGIYRAMDSSGGSAVKVQTVRIERGELSSYISADGVIEEVNKTEGFFDTPLKVNRVLVKEGDGVKKGQPLLELDMDALSSQLDTLKINRNSQMISLESKTMDAEVERALISLKAAERNYNDSKKAYEDNKALYEANAISKTELDMSENAFIEAQSGVGGLNNARLAYNTAVENRDNSKKSYEDNLKVTDIQISDLEKKISVISEQCLSPVNGIVAEINVQEGGFTSSMQAAYKIIDPNDLQVRAKINEYDIKEVEPGQKVRITGDAIDKDEEVTGSVSTISPIAVTNMMSGGNETFIEVLIKVDGAGDVLKPGLNVTCDIATVDKKDILLAPMEAITPDKDDNIMIFVVDEDTKIMEQRKVTVGINSDMQIEILEGLEEGALVVIDPQPSYADGMRVSPTENQ